MIRAYCTVCQDLIVTGQEAATGPCGHVYHKFCLATWLTQKKSCPQCRQKVTQAIILYMDEPHDQIEPSAADSVMLKDEVEHQKALNKEKERQKEYLASEIKKLEEKVSDVKDKCSTTEKTLKTERAVNAALKKQMAYFKQQEVEAAEAKREATMCRNEMERFIRLKSLVEGSRGDAEAMLQTIGDNRKSSQELVTQLIILKRELEKIKESRNRARENKDKYEREIARLKYELSSREIDIKKTTEQLALAENDLTRVEKENASLKKKMSKLEQAFNSPSPRSSAITRLMMESPAPMEFKRPRLTPPDEDDENEPLRDSKPPLTAGAGGGKADSDMELAAKEMGLTLVKTTTFTSKPSLKNAPTRLPLKPTQGRKRAAESDSGSSIFRTGYDGLGGHSSKFVQPSRPVKGPLRKVARPNMISKFMKTTKDGKEPPLPAMTLDYS